MPESPLLENAIFLPSTSSVCIAQPERSNPLFAVFALNAIALSLTKQSVTASGVCLNFAPTRGSSSARILPLVVSIAEARAMHAASLPVFSTV